MEDRDFLEHHGVKGQKWGVRRTPEQLGHRIKSGASKVKSLLSRKKSEKVQTTRKIPKKIRLKKMSDEELKKRIQRLEMETRYRQLSKSARSRGSNLVIDVLETSGKSVLTDFAKSQEMKIIKKFFKDVKFENQNTNQKTNKDNNAKKKKNKK